MYYKDTEIKIRLLQQEQTEKEPITYNHFLYDKNAIWNQKNPLQEREELFPLNRGGN